MQEGKARAELLKGEVPCEPCPCASAARAARAGINPLRKRQPGQQDIPQQSPTGRQALLPAQGMKET